MAADHKVRIIMLGECGVGKTSLMLRFCKNIFRDERKITLIVDNYNKTVLLNDIKIELELWDTVGQERFKAIVKEYFRKADGVLLAYDMTNLTTFMKLSSWLSELRELNEEAEVLIVGNKNDLEHQNQVSRSTVEKYARDEGLEFCETSAKNNENVDEVFKKLAIKVLERKKVPPFSNVKLHPTSTSKKQEEEESRSESDSSNQKTNEIEPVSKERLNGEIEAEKSGIEDSNRSKQHIEFQKLDNAEPDTCKQQTDFSLPPVIRLGDQSDVIKLYIERPKEKKRKSCC